MGAKITKLVLDVAAKTLTVSAEEESGGYIDNIKIDTQRSFVCSNEPSSVASVVAVDYEAEYVAGTITVDTSEKVTKIEDFVIELGVIMEGAACDSVLDLENDMLFVFVNCMGYMDGDAYPYSVAGVVFDQNALYKRVFATLSGSINSTKCCEIGQPVVDAVLLFEAFLLSWSTADPRKFIFYWSWC